VTHGHLFFRQHFGKRPAVTLIRNKNPVVAKPILSAFIVGNLAVHNALIELNSFKSGPCEYRAKRGSPIGSAD
jgi:hypothetical protein